MEFLPSPNFNERRTGAKVEHLILHYTGMREAAEAISHLRNRDSQVSAHYVVDTDGHILQLVDEAQRAWHAGVSFWEGKTDLNSTSIGIEIVNPGHEFGYVPFPDAQIKSVIELCHGILSRHAILPRHVLAHSDIAPTRKMDPGELFPWQWLAESGIGIFPSPYRERVSAEQTGEGRFSFTLTPPSSDLSGHLPPTGGRTSKDLAQ